MDYNDPYSYSQTELEYAQYAEYKKPSKVEFTYEQLLSYVFFDNEYDAELFLINIDSFVTNHKEFFCLCFDIFCKGLVLLYGDKGKSVDFANITIRQLENIHHKMTKIGIKTRMYEYTPEDYILLCKDYDEKIDDKSIDAKYLLEKSMKAIKGNKNDAELYKFYMFTMIKNNQNVDQIIKITYDVCQR